MVAATHAACRRTNGTARGRPPVINFYCIYAVAAFVTNFLLGLELVAITAASAPTASTSTSSAAPAAPAPPAAAAAAAVAARLFARSHDQIAAADVGAVELRDQSLGIGRDLDLDLCTNQTVKSGARRERGRAG